MYRALDATLLDDYVEIDVKSLRIGLLLYFTKDIGATIQTWKALQPITQDEPHRARVYEIVHYLG
jgi:hypothetical protein